MAAASLALVGQQHAPVVDPVIDEARVDGVSYGLCELGRILDAGVPADRASRAPGLRALAAGGVQGNDEGGCQGEAIGHRAMVPQRS